MAGTSADTKGAAVPLVRTPKQQQALEKQAAAELAKQQQLAEQAAAARLAQIVNLHIAGFTLAQIGAEIGATAQEVDRMLATDAQRYIRSQPALRTYVRNWVSAKYSDLLESVWDEATDKNHPQKLENHDRAQRVLAQMAKLHGAEAPTQAEVSVDAAPEAVEKLVAALSKAQGVGYNTDIFDLDDEDVTEVGAEIHDTAHAALEQASNHVGEPQEGDQPFGDSEEGFR